MHRPPPPRRDGIRDVQIADRGLMGDEEGKPEMQPDWGVDVRETHQLSGCIGRRLGASLVGNRALQTRETRVPRQVEQRLDFVGQIDGENGQ
jgi:hypothetical protein